MDGRERAIRLFRERFAATPSAVVRAPGRVNIIGEHTDYNDGYVLPAAIDRGLWIALSPRDDSVVEAASEEFVDRVRFRFDGALEREAGWGVYVQGLAWALREAGYELAGWRGAVASDIPIGAGLSSSAAIELAAARAFHVTSGFTWDPLAMARVAQRVENDWVGVDSGIMDQVACAAGRAGRAMLLDCRSMAVTFVPLPAATTLVVLDTGTRRRLADSEYNLRRRQCEAAARTLDVSSLRDITHAELIARSGTLDPVVLRRARHVVTENDRTLQTAAALRAGKPERAGMLMNASHQSLRDDFEVSSPALDALVEAARSVEGCLGARLTGGGFAGCAVALVAEARIAAFAERVRHRYGERTGHDTTVYVCRASDGASHSSLTDEPV